MKYKFFVILLTSFCSVLPATNSAVTAHQYQQVLLQYLFLYGMMRARLDAPVEVQPVRQPGLREHLHFQQHEIIQPGRNKQKKQKCQYYSNNKNNNRADRPKHAQINKHIYQPQCRGQKKISKGYQRL